MLRRLLGAVEDMAGNHAAPQYVSGGVGGACAAAVASTEVDFAMGTDHLAGLRVRSLLSRVALHLPPLLSIHTRACSTANE